MRIHDSDATELAQRLRVGPRELVEAIGGPWYVSRRPIEDEQSSPGTLFVGRAGPSVAILVDDGPVPDVVVGMAVGQWMDPGTLVWSLVTDGDVIHAAERDASDADVAALLAALRQAVEEAFAAKRPTLGVCRYCGGLVAPEHALGPDTCHACGSDVFGIVY